MGQLLPVERSQHARTVSDRPQTKTEARVLGYYLTISTNPAKRVRSSASSRRNQPFGFMSKLRHWTNGLQRRMAPVDGIGGLVSVGLGGRLCIIMGGWFE
jgi:hypothetical protein